MTRQCGVGASGRESGCWPHGGREPVFRPCARRSASCWSGRTAFGAVRFDGESYWLRLPAAAGPPGPLPPLTGSALVLAMVLIAVATLVSEDLTCIATGLLVARGSLEFLPATFACAAGIFFGDLGLYALGRLGRQPTRREPMPTYQRCRSWLGFLVVLLGAAGVLGSAADDLGRVDQRRHRRKRVVELVRDDPDDFFPYGGLLAAELGEQISKEDGVGDAVGFIEEQVATWHERRRAVG